MRKVSLLMALGFSMSAAVVGQRQAIGIFDVATAESLPLVETQGEPIIIPLKEDARLPRSFHVRIFKGAKEGIVANAQSRRDTRGCVWLDSAVLDVRARGQLQIQPLTVDWLRWAGDHVEPEIYTLVFESGDQPKDRILWLDQRELDIYFRHAITMQLRPNGRPIERQVLVTLKAQALSPIVSNMPTDSACWRPQEVPSKDLAKAKSHNRSIVAQLLPIGCGPRHPVRDSEIVSRDSGRASVGQ